MDPNPYFDPDIRLYSFTPLEKKIQATVLSLYRAEGVEALSVSKLCRAGGFSRTGFYYHYATPRDALTAWACDFLGHLIAISGASKRWMTRPNWWPSSSRTRPKT